MPLAYSSIRTRRLRNWLLVDSELCRRVLDYSQIQNGDPLHDIRIMYSGVGTWDGGLGRRVLASVCLFVMHDELRLHTLKKFAKIN
jgi:hypothetical protein